MFVGLKGGWEKGMVAVGCDGFELRFDYLGWFVMGDYRGLVGSVLYATYVFKITHVSCARVLGLGGPSQLDATRALCRVILYDSISNIPRGVRGNVLIPRNKK